MNYIPPVFSSVTLNKTHTDHTHLTAARPFEQSNNSACAYVSCAYTAHGNVKIVKVLGFHTTFFFLKKRGEKSYIHTMNHACIDEEELWVISLRNFRPISNDSTDKSLLRIAYYQLILPTSTSDEC
jgi:hypothetical protein